MGDWVRFFALDQETYEINIELEKNEKFLFQFFSVDEVKNREQVQEKHYITDNTPPMTTLLRLAGVYNSPQEVTLRCEDSNGSGCVESIYKVNGNETRIVWTNEEHSSSFTIGQTSVITYFSEDLYGNREKEKERKYTIDTTPPKTTVIPPGNIYSTPPEITLSCDEEVNCSIYFTLDEEEEPDKFIPYTSPIPINSNVTLRVYARDKAGNQETIQEEKYKIQANSISTKAIKQGGIYSHGLQIYLSCEDSWEQGCSETRYRLIDLEDSSAEVSMHWMIFIER